MSNLPRGWSRRAILKGGAALGAAGVAGLPMIGSALPRIGVRGLEKLLTMPTSTGASFM